MEITLAVFLALAFGITVAKGIHAAVSDRSPRSLGQARHRLRTGAPRLAEHVAVTVTGTVRARDDLLEAPLTGRRVVFHCSVARVTELGVRVVASELVPFELETAEGIVRVEGETAETAFPALPVIPRRIERVQRFITSHGIDFGYARKASVDEIAVEPGARISVHGVARVDLDPASTGERGFREAAPTRMTLEAAPGHPLTLGPPD